MPNNEKYSLSLALRVADANVRESDLKSLLKSGIQLLGRQKHLNKKMRGGEIQVVLVSDEDISILNEIYREKEGPTDVISLSYFYTANFPGDKNLVGEILISADTAAKQAKEHKKTLKQEIQFLFVHGLLHIFGYDHEKARERKVMFDLQDEILGTKSWRKLIE